MDPTFQASLTPEQLAAINASGGFANCEDPVTHVRYQLMKCDPPSLDEDYIRQKLAEAALDIERGNVAEWDAEEIKAYCRARFEKKRAGS